MSTLSIRQAVLSDLADLADLFDAYRQFYGQQSDVNAAHAFLLARFNHGESVLFIAHDGTTPVGFTQLYPIFSSISLRRTFVLNDLFVSPSHRKSGVASRLMAAAAGFARAVGAQSISLSTAVTNTTAQSVYAAAGWRLDDGFLVYELTL